MKMHIPFHCLACLLATFISCNHSSLGQCTIHSDEQSISCSSSKDQTETFTQSVFEWSNKFISDFRDEIMDDITKLIPLNPQDDDWMHKHKSVARQLYHVFSSSYINCLLAQDKQLDGDCSWETYTIVSNRFRKKINRDFMAKYVIPDQYFRKNFQHPYDIQPSNDTNAMEKLGKLLFDSIKDQIIVEITDVQKRTDKNRIDRPEAYPELDLDYKKIVKQAKKAIDKIIKLQFKNNKKFIKDDILMFKTYMKQTNLLKSAITPDEASIYECLGNYFLKLKAKYYDSIQEKGQELFGLLTKELTSLIEKGAIQQKDTTCFSFMKNTITSPIKKAPIQSEGDEVVRSIEENMNPLPVDDLNLAPLEASMNRLMHTIRIYNAIRLLFHFGLMYNSMRFALAKIAAPGTNPASDSDIESFVCNTVAITHQIDVYLALVHLGMADTHVKETYPKLLEACVNMAKPSPKATKA